MIFDDRGHGHIRSQCAVRRRTGPSNWETTMNLNPLALGLGISLMSTGAYACAFENTQPVSSLSAGFEAWKSVTDAMAECGNFEAELDQEFRTKQPAAAERIPFDNFQKA